MLLSKLEIIKEYYTLVLYTKLPRISLDWSIHNTGTEYNV